MLDTRTQTETWTPIHPMVRPGHIHLRVSDLERSMAFYRDVLGFELIQNSQGTVAFMSAGGYHHHVALNTWDSLNGTPPPRGHTGILHIAFTYPSRKELAIAYKRLLDRGVQVRALLDHGVTEAIYFDDPDGIGIEISWDCPPERWDYLEDGTLNVALSIPFDGTGLLSELDRE
jgi:catechol 2,3-dioxygenase